MRYSRFDAHLILVMTFCELTNRFAPVNGAWSPCTGSMSHLPTANDSNYIIALEMKRLTCWSPAGACLSSSSCSKLEETLTPEQCGGFMSHLDHKQKPNWKSLKIQTTYMSLYILLCGPSLPPKYQKIMSRMMKSAENDAFLHRIPKIWNQVMSPVLFVAQWCNTPFCVAKSGTFRLSQSHETRSLLRRAFWASPGHSKSLVFRILSLQTWSIMVRCSCLNCFMVVLANFVLPVTPLKNIANTRIVFANMTWFLTTAWPGPSQAPGEYFAQASTAVPWIFVAFNQQNT